MPESDNESSGLLLGTAGSLPIALSEVASGVVGSKAGSKQGEQL
jgi:hypothetical protein